MANKSDLETYIMRCVRKYEQDNPDKKIHARKTIEIPIQECAFCSGKESVIDIPFSIQIRIIEKKMVIALDNEMFGIDINNCPICGREL